MNKCGKYITSYEPNIPTEQVWKELTPMFSKLNLSRSLEHLECSTYPIPHLTNPFPHAELVLNLTQYKECTLPQQGIRHLWYVQFPWVEHSGFEGLPESNCSIAVY